MTRRAQAVLAAIVALQLIAETALVPFYPALFDRLFGVEELAATGTYLTLCRVAGLVALPLWGLAALRWPIRTLLISGLLASAVLDLALAFSPSLGVFTALSSAVVATGSVMILAYPALIAITERSAVAASRADRPGAVGDRHRAVVTYWSVFHAATASAVVIGAAVVVLPEPRIGLAAFAALDLALACAVMIWVPLDSPRARDRSRRAVARVNRARDARLRSSRSVRPALALIGVIVVVDLALAVPRPFFVEALLRGRFSPVQAGLMQLIPALASLCVLPFARRTMARGVVAAAGMSATVAAVGLLLQALAVHSGVSSTATVLALVAGRVAMGLGAGLLLVILDQAVFARIGARGPAFSALETGRSLALLAAPTMATVAVGYQLGAPLLVGAVLLVVAAIVAASPVCRLRTIQGPSPSIPHSFTTQPSIETSEIHRDHEPDDHLIRSASRSRSTRAGARVARRRRGRLAPSGPPTLSTSDGRTRTRTTDRSDSDGPGPLSSRSGRRRL